MSKFALFVAATVALVVVASASSDSTDKKEIEERLRQLKSENNEIDHGSADDVAAVKAADGSGNNNGLLGHWGEQKRWRRLGPKKQRKLKYGRRGHKRRNKPRKNPHDLDDARLQDLGFDLPAAAQKDATAATSVGPEDIPERPRRRWRGRGKPRKFMKKKNKNQIKLAEKEAMRKALEKGMPAEKVLETFKREGQFRNRFYKKFVKKYERKMAKKGVGSKKGAAAAAKGDEGSDTAQPPLATP